MVAKTLNNGFHCDNKIISAINPKATCSQTSSQANLLNGTDWISFQILENDGLFHPWFTQSIFRWCFGSLIKLKGLNSLVDFNSIYAKKKKSKIEIETMCW